MLQGIPILGEAIRGVVGLIDQVVTDKDAAAEIRARMAELEAGARAQDNAILQAQIALNKVEATHASLFVAGWRPALGWLCVAALGYAYLGHPALMWLSGWLMTMTHYPLPVPPPITLGELYPIVLGMLGLSGVRTVEKLRGVARAKWRNPDQ